MKDLVDAARAAGLTVVLDGRIGQQDYRSVSGSLPALQRFADAYADERIEPGDIADRLRNRAALQIDDGDAHLMRAAARAIARLHYAALAHEASPPSTSTGSVAGDAPEPSSTSR